MKENNSYQGLARNKAMSVALLLEEDLRAHPAKRLPSLDVLARTYCTSRVTMHKAVRQLCLRGLLDTRPGQGTTVTPSLAGGAQVQSRAECVEERLRSLIAGTTSAYLPSIVELAKCLHTSSTAVRAALGRLEKDGLVSISPRRRAAICSNMEKEADVSMPIVSEESLYQRLRVRIESGVYPTGQPLPKFEYLTGAEHVSVRSVARAYRRIERDGLVYRKGRTRYVGAPLSVDGLGLERHRKCVLIVQPNEATWNNFVAAPWTMAFAHSFLREMSLYGVEPLAALVRSRTEKSPYSITPAGKGSISRLAARLNDRLLGILVVNHGWTTHDIDFTRKSIEYSEWLCAFGKPVVFFDHMVSAQEEFFGPEMHAMLKRSLETPEVKRCFTRCYMDAFGVTSLAILTMHRYGHRTIGYPMPYTPPAWMTVRRDFLRLSNEKLGLSVRILDAIDCPPLFDTQEDVMLSVALSVLSRIDRPFAHSVIKVIEAMGDPATPIGTLTADQKEVMVLTAHLGAFCINPAFTAIIAPNDEHARMFYRWFLVAGIRIPKDISLLSFDDRVESSYPYTISSINFGFDSLGFTAFHTMLGDIPVKADKWLSVAAKCRINHYATIGRARDMPSKDARE